MATSSTSSTSSTMPYTARPYTGSLTGAGHDQFWKDHGRTSGNVPKRTGLSKKARWKIYNGRRKKKGEKGYKKRKQSITRGEAGSKEREEYNKRRRGNRKQENGEAGSKEREEYNKGRREKGRPDNKKRKR